MIRNSDAAEVDDRAAGPRPHVRVVWPVPASAVPSKGGRDQCSCEKRERKVGPSRSGRADDGRHRGYRPAARTERHCQPITLCVQSVRTPGPISTINNNGELYEIGTISSKRKPMVGSSGERNTLGELSAWRHEAKSPSRPRVKFERNSIQIILAVSG
jgi:hypothetical protein